VGNSIIVGRNGLVKVGLKIFDLGLQHHVMGLAVLLLEFVQLAFLLLEFLTNRFQRVLDAEKLALLLLELAGVVVYLSLQGLQLRLGGIHSCQRFVDRIVRFKACVHILVLFSKSDFSL
jgi:hypothetical protein